MDLRIDGRSCLIVEDESLIAMLIEEAVVEMGLTVVGPASHVDRALELLDNEPNPACAVLDINLAGELVQPVARILAERGVPFIYVSGYGDSELSTGLPSAPVLEKPFLIEQLQAAIRKVLSTVSPGS